MSAASQFEKDGFLIVPGVIGDDVAKLLIAALGPKGAFAGLRQVHETMPAVRDLIASQAIRHWVELILGEQARVVRSICFDKNVENNWAVPWHQDLTIAVREKVEAPGFVGWSMKHGALHVQAPRDVLEKMLTVRLHLDDCGAENGPLSVLAGSHREGWLNAEQIDVFKATVSPTVCTTARGGAVLMRPLLLHSSARATKPDHRRVLHLEFSASPLPFGLKWV